MSVTTAADVRALVKSSASDGDLQAIIDREEAYLARELRAPIAGERTQQVWRLPFQHSYSDITLMRPTDAVTTVVDNGVTLDLSRIRLLDTGGVIELADGPWSGPLIEVTYTPNDELEVVRVVVELCRLTLQETGYSEEQIGTYRYSRGRSLATPMQIQASSRRTLVRSLMLQPRLGSPRLERGTSTEREAVVVPAS